MDLSVRGVREEDAGRPSHLPGSPGCLLRQPVYRRGDKVEGVNLLIEKEDDWKKIPIFKSAIFPSLILSLP